MSEIKRFTVNGVCTCRLDKYLSTQIPELSRTKIKHLIQHYGVSVNGSSILDPSHIVKNNDELVVAVICNKSSEESLHGDCKVDFPIVYEDEYLMVISKPSGLLVHPGAGRSDQLTLIDYLRAYCGENLSTIAGAARPGIVHRLDMETSGLMLVAKNDITHAMLSEQLERREIKRVYKAITWSVIAPKFGRIETHLQKAQNDRTRVVVSRLVGQGKLAITNYRVLEEFYSGSAALLELRLETGRTHQIRVHLAYRKTPVIGDKIYGKNFNYPIRGNTDLQKELKAFPRHALHSAELSFLHPHRGEHMEFSDALPKDMQNMLEKLRIMIA